MITLSVLDQSPIRAGGTPQQALQETILLAQAADRLGYTRYWLAEHHSSESLASASPEVLIPVVASNTKHIRVGSGGVMLTHYSALHVAEQFRMMETLFPGRIDLGIGRAPGSDGRTAVALANGRRMPLEQYPQQIKDLMTYLTGSMPKDSPFAGIRAMPSGDTVPEVWLLGSGIESAQFAAQQGLGFSFAHFIAEGPYGPEVVQMYRDMFKPSEWLMEPRVNIGVNVTCADTAERAQQLAMSRWISRLRSNRTNSRNRGIPSVEESLKEELTQFDREYIEGLRNRSVVGTAQQVKESLTLLGEEFGADDFVIVTITYDFRERVHSYELLADAFGLQRRD